MARRNVLIIFFAHYVPFFAALVAGFILDINVVLNVVSAVIIGIAVGSLVCRRAL